MSSTVQTSLGRCPLAPMLDISLVQTTLSRCPLAPLLAVSLVQATLGRCPLAPKLSSLPHFRNSHQTHLAPADVWP